MYKRSSKKDLAKISVPEQDASDPGSKSRAKLSKVKKGKAAAPVPEQDALNTELSRLFSNKSSALRLFEQNDFSPEAFINKYLGSLSEKAVDATRNDISRLSDHLSAEIEQVVHDHYELFLRACEGVDDLEDKVQLLRNYVNGVTALLADLKQAKSVSAKALADAGAPSGGPEPSSPSPTRRRPPSRSRTREQQEESAASPARARIARVEARMQELLQQLEVAVAERDFEGVRAALDVGEEMVQMIDDDAEALSEEVTDFPSWKHSFESGLRSKKHAVMRVLERLLGQANTSGPELRHAAGVLVQLTGDCHATHVMLRCYSLKIRQHQAQLLKMQAAGGGDPDGYEYSGALAQRTFLSIGRAADDLAVIFAGRAATDTAAVFTVWAAEEARRCAGLLRQHALVTYAAPAGLAPTMHCVALARVFVLALEHSHGLSLTAPFTTELWPFLDGVIRKHVRRLTDELKLTAPEDVDNLLLQATAADVRRAGSTPATLDLKLITASILVQDLQVLTEMLLPLAGPRAAAALRRAVSDAVGVYTGVVAHALKMHVQLNPAAGAKLGSATKTIVSALTSLIEEEIPAAVEAMQRVSGQVVDEECLDKFLNVVTKQCARVKAQADEVQ